MKQSRYSQCMDYVMSHQSSNHNICGVCMNIFNLENMISVNEFENGVKFYICKKCDKKDKINGKNWIG